jgi:WD40 repeat protein
MHIRMRPVLLSLCVLGAAQGVAGAPAVGAGAPGKKDVGRRGIVGDPLPAGAVARIGSLRLRHSDPVTALAVSPDGKWIASHCQWEEYVAVWESASGKLRGRLPIAGVGKMAFAADGSMLAVVLPTGAFTAEVLIECWDIATAKKAHRFRAEERYLDESVLSFSPDSKHLYFGRSSLRRFELAAGKLDYELAMGQKTNNYGDEAVTALALSRDGGAVFTAEGDATVRIRDARTGKERCRADNVSASTLALSPDGSVLAVGMSGAVELWQIPPAARQVGGITFSKRPLPIGNDTSIIGLAFSNDGTTLLSLGSGGAVGLWDAVAGKRLLQRSLPVTQLAELAFDSAGQPLVFSADDSSRCLRIWNARDGKQLFSEREIGNAITCMSFSTNGKIVATGHDDRALRFWHAVTGQLLGRLSLPESPCQIDFAADGKSLVAGGNGQWWNVSLAKATDGGGFLAALSGTPGPGSPWHKPAPYRGRALPWKIDTVDECTLAPDGLILDLQRDVVRVLEGASRKARCELKNNKYYAAVLAPNRRSLAVAVNENTVTIADLATGEEMDHLELPPEEMTGGALRLLRPGLFLGKMPRLAFAPGGRLLAIGMPSGAILFYDLATSQPVHRLAGHDVPISGLSFAPDGRTLACAYRDTTVLVWDVSGVAPKAFSAAQLTVEKHWQDLQAVEGDPPPPGAAPAVTVSAAPGAGVAWKAHWGLVNGANQSVSFLKGHLRPVQPVDVRPLAQKIKEFDSPRFAVRQQAMKDVEEMGQAAEAGLRQALKGKVSLETSRRLQRLLEKVDEGRRREVQQQRAVAVLEQIATVEARDVLTALAAGDSKAPLTAAARAALKRLTK